MNGVRRNELENLQGLCGVRFKNIEFLNTALTHPTYAFEHPPYSGQHNQRLEFLGDAVLGLLMAEILYRRYPDVPEGELTRMRASLVCEATLSRVAKRVELGKFLLLGRGEAKSGGMDRASILADAVESLIAAIYLDRGLESARSFVLSLLGDELESLQPGRTYNDYKTALQETVQRQGGSVDYAIVGSSGPDHCKHFLATVAVDGHELARGEGLSKKEAEQEAARRALSALGGRTSRPLASETP